MAWVVRGAKWGRSKSAHHLGVQLDVVDVARGGRALLHSLSELLCVRDAPTAHDGHGSSICGRGGGHRAAKLGGIFPQTPVDGGSDGLSNRLLIVD